MPPNATTWSGYLCPRSYGYQASLDDTAKLLVVPWGDKWYAVPVSRVISFQKCGNFVFSPKKLGQILGDRGYHKWMPHLQPECLFRIRVGAEGSSENAVFTTFALEGHPEERRILRPVPPRVADRVFPRLKDERRGWTITNERQQIREAVLDWKEDIDLPTPIDPVAAGWQPTSHPGSCAIAPPPRPRTGKELLDQLSCQVTAAMPFLPPDQSARMRSTLHLFRQDMGYYLDWNEQDVLDPDGLNHYW